MVCLTWKYASHWTQIIYYLQSIFSPWSLFLRVRDVMQPSFAPTTKFLAIIFAFTRMYRRFNVFHGKQEKEERKRKMLRYLNFLLLELGTFL